MLNPYGRPIRSESISTSTATEAGNLAIPPGYIRIASATATFFRHSRDPILDTEFEQGDTFNSSNIADNDTWKTVEDLVTIRKNTTSPLSGLADVKLTGVAALNTNGSLDTWAAGAPNNWTESGTGAINEETTNKVSGSSAAFVNGLGQTAVLTGDAVTVVAGKKYTVAAHVKSDGTNAFKLQVKDNNGKYLQSDGTWSATEQSWATVSAGSFTSKELEFSPDAAAASVQLIGKNDVASTTMYLDEYYLADGHQSFLHGVTAFPLRASTAYRLRFNHKSSAADIPRLRYAIKELTNPPKYLQSDGTWGATAFFFVLNGVTASTQQTKAFTSDLEMYYQVVLGAMLLPAASFTAQLDRVYITEDALTSDPLLPSNGFDFLYSAYQGRIVAILGSGTGTLTVTQLG